MSPACCTLAQSCDGEFLLAHVILLIVLIEGGRSESTNEGTDNRDFSAESRVDAFLSRLATRRLKGKVEKQ